MSANSETSLEVVINRLEKVEKENRFLKRAVFVPTVLSGMLVLVFAVAAMKKDGGDKSPPYKSESGVADVIRAKKLEIVDGSGKTRIDLETDEKSSQPLLTMYDEKGNRRARLVVYRHGPALLLSDEKGHAMVILHAISGFSGLTLSDEKGIAAQFQAFGDVRSLELWDEAGSIRAWLRLDDDGPALQLIDKDQNVIWGHPLTKSELPGASNPNLPDDDGDRIWQLPPK